MKLTLGSVFLLSSVLIACGPSVSGTGGDDDDDTSGIDGGNQSYADAGTCVVTGTEGTVETCSDGKDNDCDGVGDCYDPDCSGVGECPVCGEVDTTEGAGITLPDGVSSGTSCTTDADCSGSTPNCVETDAGKECHASYTSTLNVVGFGDNQIFDNANIIQAVCVNIEHTWLRDLEIRLVAPDGQIVRMQKFQGRTGGEVYLGEAYDCDEGSPEPGTGAEYCWKPDATNSPMITYANNSGTMNTVDACDPFGLGLTSADELPPGDYQADDDWSALIGTHLNGEWKFVVTDLWAEDNGFLFDWTINFDPQEVGDCSGPIVN